MPQSLVACLQPDCLASEGVADEHRAAIPLDIVVAALLDTIRILVLRQAARQRPHGQLVDLAKRLHAERLVRPLVDVGLLKPIERLLLRPDR